MSTLATIPAPAWAEYRKLLERRERAPRGSIEVIEAHQAVQAWEYDAMSLHGPPSVSDIADLLLRVSDSEWAAEQIAHLQHQLDEQRRANVRLRGGK